MVILDFEVLDTFLKKIVENTSHQKDAQRNSVQKEVLNNSPAFFSTSLVKNTLEKRAVPPPNITMPNQQFGRRGRNSRCPGQI